jgi:hypothetical protein
MAMAMAMDGKQKKLNLDANKGTGTRAFVVILGGLCMPHGNVKKSYGPVDALCL